MLIEKEANRILKEIEFFDGDYMLEATDGKVLLNYIKILEEELKQSNKSIEYWAGKYKELLESKGEE